VGGALERNGLVDQVLPLEEMEAKIHRLSLQPVRKR